MFYFYFLEAGWFGVVFFGVCFSRSSVGLISLILDTSSSPRLSVALRSVLRTATISLCLLKEQVERAGCWVAGKLISILLVPEACHILVKTMCCLINRLRPQSLPGARSACGPPLSQGAVYSAWKSTDRTSQLNGPFISPILWQEFLGSKAFINIRLKGRQQNSPERLP